MSANYEKIKYYYMNGLWDKNRVYNMVVKGVISEEEFRLIVGKDYK